MIERPVVAVHLTEDATWTSHGETTVVRPAGVALGPGGLVVGVDRAMALSDDVFEPAPIRFVDDEVLLLGTVAVPVVDVLTETLAAAVATVGVATPVDLLVVTCPTGWGTRRRRVLVAAGRALAREVRVVAVAELAAAAVDGDRDGAGLVVEVGVLASAAAVTTGGTWIAADSIGAMDLAESAAAATELVETIHRGLQSAPGWVAIVGVSDASAAALADGLHRVWGSDVRVCEVPARTLVEGAHAWGLRHSGVRGAAGGPGDARMPAARPRRLAIAAVAVLAVAAAGVTTFAMIRSGESTSEPPELVVPAPRVASGRATVEIPSGWHPRTPPALPDRVELVRDDGQPARILLVHKELVPGADLDAVAVTLGGQIAERADTFGPLSRNEDEGRPALTYRENPDPDSQVRWTVFVTDGLQVSVGCQAPHTSPEVLEPACSSVLRSVSVTPA